MTQPGWRRDAQIAKNCRTSVEMVEKYYASHIKTRLDAAAINVMRPHKTDKKKDKRSSPHTGDAPQRNPEGGRLSSVRHPVLNFSSDCQACAGVAEWQTLRT